MKKNRTFSLLLSAALVLVTVFSGTPVSADEKSEQEGNIVYEDSSDFDFKEATNNITQTAFLGGDRQPDRGTGSEIYRTAVKRRSEYAPASSGRINSYINYFNPGLKK